MPPEEFDRHFTPPYSPWEQRVCLTPDGDFFKPLRSGRASIVTDTVDRFTPEGILLASGALLEADMVVTATGLRMAERGDSGKFMCSGVRLSEDGVPIEVAQRLLYQGCMLSGVPNFGFGFGYTNASWTLKVDLVSSYFVRLVKRLEASGHTVVVPTPGDTVAPRDFNFSNFSSGYVSRSMEFLPKQGSESPWVLRQNYLLDWLHLGPLSRLREWWPGAGREGLHFSQPHGGGGVAKMD